MHMTLDLKRTEQIGMDILKKHAGTICEKANQAERLFHGLFVISVEHISETQFIEIGSIAWADADKVFQSVDSIVAAAWKKINDQKSQIQKPCFIVVLRVRGSIAFGLMS